MMKWAQDLDLKFLMQMILLIKKAKIWFCLENIEESWACLCEAQKKLDDASVIYKINIFIIIYFLL